MEQNINFNYYSIIILTIICAILFLIYLSMVIYYITKKKLLYILDWLLFINFRRNLEIKDEKNQKEATLKEKENKKINIQ